MKIARWKEGDVSNYGDMLNEFIWPKVLDNGMSKILPEAMFYGIGTILNPPQFMPKASHHVIFGAGAGYYGPPSFESPVKTYFVRGPVTARYMPNARSITDPGVLIRKFFDKQAPIYDCSFMPRWNSVSDELKDGCRKAGINLINPTDPVPKVTLEIASSKLLLTEALHGAVTADSLRVPWVCMYFTRGHEFKWYDWCASMNIIWNKIDAQELGLTWAWKYAVPQLSASSVLDRVTREIEEQIEVFNSDVKKGIF